MSAAVRAALGAQFDATLAFCQQQQHAASVRDEQFLSILQEMRSGFGHTYDPKVEDPDPDVGESEASTEQEIDLTDSPSPDGGFKVESNLPTTPETVEIISDVLLKPAGSHVRKLSPTLDNLPFGLTPKPPRATRSATKACTAATGPAGKQKPAASDMVSVRFFLHFLFSSHVSFFSEMIYLRSDISAVLSLFQVDVVSYAVDVRHMFFITFIFSFLPFIFK